MPDVWLDETAEGNVYAALRMREADLDKHLANGSDEKKDAEREKAREEARKKLEEEIAKQQRRAQAAARIRHRRGLPAGAGAEPVERPAGDGQQDRGRAQGRGQTK